jgi:hypothetical protein
MEAKPQFDSVHERTVRLKNLFLIRIYNRDPGPHILAKHRLVGTGGELFAFTAFFAMAVVTRFSAAMVSFFNFSSCS